MTKRKKRKIKTLDAIVEATISEEVFSMRRRYVKSRIFTAGLTAAICIFASLSPAFDLGATGLELYEDPFGGSGQIEDGVMPGTASPSQVSIYEKYNSDFELYEESISDMFFFYSNVSNGSMSAGPVSLEFPSNLTYEFQKDGAGYNYTNKTQITEQGNYLVRVKGIYNDREYVGTFRFSIREMPKDEEPEEIQDDFNPEDLTEEDLLDMEDEIDEEDLMERANASLDELDAENPEENAAFDYDMTETGLTESYNSFVGLFSYYLFSGTEIQSSVQNGAVINGTVSLTVPDEVEYTVFVNGEETENPEKRFSDPGFYRIVFKEPESLDFNMSYQSEKDYPYLHFRIVGKAVNDMEVFNAPKNAKITSVYFNNEAVLEGTEEEPVSLDFYQMPEDGAYSFKIFSSVTGRTETVNVTKDTKAPGMSIGIKNGTASIKYSADDLAEFALWKNGELVSAFNPSTIKGKGSYELYVTDYAGNTTGVKFTLKNAVNFGSIAAILLFLAIIAAGYVLVRRTKSVIRVR